MVRQPGGRPKERTYVCSSSSSSSASGSREDEDDDGADDVD